MGVPGEHLCMTSSNIFSRLIICQMVLETSCPKFASSVVAPIQLKIYNFEHRNNKENKKWHFMLKTKYTLLPGIGNSAEC